jgi:hypothetical protein
VINRENHDIRTDPLLETTLVNRVRAEYEEMPGMKLTPRQVARLCGARQALCQAVLDALVEEGFLCVRANGAYARQSDGVQPRSAKAGIRSAHNALAS